MKIRWRGHASFLIETGGQRIVTDPFNAEVGYPMVPLEADIVTVSHEHWDHNAVESIGGDPLVIKGVGAREVEGIFLHGIDSCHDINQGRDRGANTIFKISAEGIHVVHLGDLGHPLSAEQVAEIGQVDILLVPVGGTFTIDSQGAVTVANLLQPRIVIPMHYATPHLSFELAPVEGFTSQYDLVVKKPYLEVQAADLGAEMRIVVLDYL